MKESIPMNFTLGSVVRVEFKKMGKTLTDLRKSSIGGFAAMGVMNKHEAERGIMQFQEDIIMQQAQIDTEQTTSQQRIQIEKLQEEVAKKYELIGKVGYSEMIKQQTEGPV